MDSIQDAASRIAAALAPAPVRSGTAWRWGTVASNNGDGTLEVMVGTDDPEGAVTLSATSAATMASPGKRVRVSFQGSDAIVDAILATSGYPDLDIIAGTGIDISGRTISVDATELSYADLQDKPSIEAHELVGDSSLDDISVHRLTNSEIDALMALADS